MSKVVLELTMSLDGYVAARNISRENPLGEGGLRLHDWMFVVKTEVDEQLTDEIVESSGAVIVGGRTYIDAIEDGWGGETPFKVPAFVLLHQIPEKAVAGFTYVTDGIESALTQAKAAAGDKNVWVMGGANIAQQYIKAGLIDELHIHIAPVLLGAGTRLFDHLNIEPIELEPTRVLQTPGATHLRFRVVKPSA